MDQQRQPKPAKNTERFRAANLDTAFLSEMAKATAAMKAAGYDPYAQLTGYVRTGNVRYITREGNARDMVAQMDLEKIKAFLRYCI